MIIKYYYDSMKKNNWIFLPHTKLSIGFKHNSDDGPDVAE